MNIASNSHGLSNSSESFLQVSKWLTSAMLLETAEMEQLFQALGKFYIFQVSSICKKDEETLSQSQFLEVYKQYLDELKAGTLDDEKRIRIYFSSVFTADQDVVTRIPLQDEQQIIRVIKPVVQLQSHRIHYSDLEGKFRSKVFGKETISWGLQFSYPQLFLDQKTQEVIKLIEGDRPNTQLFQTIQRWSRSNTIPTPFIVDGRKINVPMRLGKQCLSWINSHPHLLEKNIQVAT